MCIWFIRMNETGKRLKEERARLGMSQSEFGEMCGVKLNAQANYEKGDRQPNADYLANADEIGVDVLYLLTGKKLGSQNSVAESSVRYNASTYIEIPLLNIKASAGHGAEILTEESDRSLIFKKEWINAHHLHSKDLVMIHATGDSMEPSIYCGDELLIDKSPMDRFVDGIYIIRIEKDLFVKRLRKRLTGSIDIISDNPAYPIETIDVNSDLLHVIGKVVWIGRAV